MLLTNEVAWRRKPLYHGSRFATIQALHPACVGKGEMRDVHSSKHPTKRDVASKMRSLVVPTIPRLLMLRVH